MTDTAPVEVTPIDLTNEDEVLDLISDCISESFDEEWTARDGARHVLGGLQHEGITLSRTTQCSGDTQGPTVADAWDELVNVDDRTSPEEYPDMCLITRDELADFMTRAALPNKVVDTQEVVEALRDIQPRAYRYQFSDPISGKPVWRTSSGPWNGQAPKATEALYSVEQIAALSSDKTVELLREVRALLWDAGTSSVRLEYSSNWHERRRAALAKLNSHLGEMK